MSSTQHLSDEAVAAFADGVLRGPARERATRHVNSCVECRRAVRVQREAALALRSSGVPSAPSDLMDRLRALPMTTPISTLPTAVGPDGSTMLSTFAPTAALVPTEARPHRTRHYVTSVAVVALAGALVAGSVSREEAARTGAGKAAHTAPAGGSQPGFVNPVSFFRGAQP